ncbi:MAG: hypothetical protein H0X38_02910 [Planctomycetes bacterium]|nr:hypothetical protein [Planctomycetota bacterium]
MNRTRSHHLRAAFTLIEIMIATGLGVGIIGVSFAAFRVASQAATVANRLSLENALMRAGYARAQEELDFWQGYDDALDPAQEQLRSAQSGSGRGAHGLMFAPMAQMLPAGGALEDAVGWDPQGWLPHDPRTWYRGNMAEKVDSLLIFGRYAIFASADDVAPQLYADQPPAPPATATVFQYQTYAVAAVPHHWHDRQLRDFLANTGFFLLGEYLPPNSIYSFMRSYDGASGDSLAHTNLGGIPLLSIQPGGTDSFCNTDGNQRDARGKYRETYRTTWAALPANSPLQVQTTDPAFISKAFAERWGSHRRYYETGYGSTPNTMAEFVRVTTIVAPLLDRAPAHWPRVQVSVNRFIGNARCTTLFRLDLANPLTGSVFELSFTGFGTTLRGARQQRFFDPTDTSSPDDPARRRGWARWDNDGSLPDTNLDTPRL